MNENFFTFGMEVVVISTGPYKDMKGRIVKILPTRSENGENYKVRFDRLNGSNKDIFYRWLKASELIPANDEGFRLIFAD